ncbi:MAG: hypothetical protein N3E51_00110 [Candidatus Micrarchaeota archaeon]|nr:hypothetical protein [Candidatus Micrarchaeota archaeon]
MQGNKAGSSRGQSSFEALLAAGFLLSALAILVFSAQRLSSEFLLQARSSSSRMLLASAASAIDEQGWCASAVPMSWDWKAAASPDGSCIHPPLQPSLCEPVFHNVSSAHEGKIYVQAKAYEPI